jgi:AcrR family transcriptional regulator
VGYAKSNDTIDAILGAGRKLFYEKGYNATSYSEIAVTAGVNEGLIHYHFKTKLNIAQTIYDELLATTNARIKELVPDENGMVISSLNTKVTCHYMEQEGYRRFLSELIEWRVPMKSAETVGKSYLLDMNKGQPFATTDAEMRLLSVGYAALESEMMLAYATGRYGLSFDRFTDLITKAQLQALLVPAKTIDDVLERARDIFDRLDIEMLPEFETRISCKG